jgi:hypothetical protein
MTPTRPTRILILGGGFGGVYTALTLEKLLKREIAAGDVELGLVSRENYMVFQPMLPEVISGSIGLTDTIAPIRRLCPNTNLYTRTIAEVLKQSGSGTSTSLRRLGVGECFGEIALVSDKPRTATVRAVKPTNVLAVDREAFQALFATLPPMKRFVETLIATRDR